MHPDFSLELLFGMFICRWAVIRQHPGSCSPPCRTGGEGREKIPHAPHSAMLVTCVQPNRTNANVRNSKSPRTPSPRTSVGISTAPRLLESRFSVWIFVADSEPLSDVRLGSDPCLFSSIIMDSTPAISQDMERSEPRLGCYRELEKAARSKTIHIRLRPSTRTGTHPPTRESKQTMAHQ
jgi:hypothetical protein